MYLNSGGWRWVIWLLPIRIAIFLHFWGSQKALLQSWIDKLFMCLCFTARRSIGPYFRNTHLKILKLCLNYLPSFAISRHQRGRMDSGFLAQRKGLRKRNLWCSPPESACTSLLSWRRKGRVGWHRCAQHLFGLTYGKTVLTKITSASVLSSYCQKKNTCSSHGWENDLLAFAVMAFMKRCMI